MSSRFEECLAFVLSREGGFVNHPNDRGGATNKGICQRTYDEWRERKGKVCQSVRYIEDAEVSAIYYEQYWCPIRAEIVPAPLDLILFDSAVNHGTSRAVKLLQRALDMTQITGFFGTITRATLEKFVAKQGIEELAERYMTERDAFYDQIVANDPTQQVFAKGWANRLAHLREAAFA